MAQHHQRIVLVNHITFIRFTNLLSFRRVSRIYCQIKLYLLLFTLICGARRCSCDAMPPAAAAAAAAALYQHIPARAHPRSCSERKHGSLTPHRPLSPVHSSAHVTTQFGMHARMHDLDDVIVQMYILDDNEVTFILICVFASTPYYSNPLVPFEMNLEFFFILYIFFANPLRLNASDEIYWPHRE